MSFSEFFKPHGKSIAAALMPDTTSRIHIKYQSMDLQIVLLDRVGDFDKLA